MQEANIDTLPYLEFFNVIDRKPIDELFPTEAISQNILVDINKRAFHFPYFLRKTIMSHFKWPIVDFLENASISEEDGAKRKRKLSTVENKAIVKITLYAIHVFRRYLETKYGDLLEE